MTNKKIKSIKTPHKHHHAEAVAVARHKQTTMPKPRRRYALFDEKQREPRQLEYTDFSSLLMIIRKHFDSPQMMALICLLLVGGAYAAEVSANVLRVDDSTPATSKKSKALMRDGVYESVCTNSSLHTYNKPNLTVDVDAKGYIIPKSCLTSQKSARCQDDMQKWDYFIDDDEHYLLNYNKLEGLRYYGKQQIARWSKQYEDELGSLRIGLSHDEQTQTTALSNKIKTLCSYAQYAELVQKENGGDCGEHTYVAMTRLLQQSIAYHLEIKIHFVSVAKSGRIHGLADHSFLLVDSNAKETVINNDRAAVADFLDSLDQGKICDPWNQGYLHDSATDGSHLYSSKAGWDKLQVKEISIDFSRLAQLPVRIKHYVCQTLSAAGFNVSKQSACESFFSPKASTSSAGMDEQEAASSMSTDIAQTILG